MTEKIIKFPDKAASVWREIEKYYDRVGYLDEEGKAYAKKIFKDIIERYDGWDFKYTIANSQNLNIVDRESFVRWLEKDVEGKVNKNMSKLFAHLVSQIIFLEIKVYRLQKGLE